MRKTSTALLGAGLCLLMVAVPSASAQITETSEVLESGETRVVHTLITDGGDITVTTDRLIAADGCSEKVTITTETVEGSGLPIVPVVEYESRESSLPLTARPSLVTTVAEEENELACTPPSPPLTDAIPDEVLGLAITGSNVDMPIAIGVSLIGVGGLLVAATKKRRNADS